MFLRSSSEVEEVPSLQPFKMEKYVVHLHSTWVTQGNTTFDSEFHHPPHTLSFINL